MDKQEVLFDPYPKQMQFVEAAFSGKYSVILYGGAIRGGKTYAGLGTIILLCRAYPMSRWAVVRDSLPTLKRNTIPSFDKIKPAAFIKRYNQETQVVTFTNGSQIIFFPENYDQDKELNRWKGLEVNGFLFEEMNELQEVSFYKGIERAGTYIPPAGYKKAPSLILGTCNPTQNWVKKKMYSPWKLGELPEKWLYIPAKITDNPYMMADSAYIAQLEQMPKYQYLVYVEGEWDVNLKTGLEFYKCFELDKNVDRVKYNPELPIHLSFDENTIPYLPAGLFQIYSIRDARGALVKYRVVMFDEITGRPPTNRYKNVCQEFERRYPGHTAGLFIYGDATSQKEDAKLEQGHDFFRLILGALKKYHPNLRVLKSNPSVAMRGNWINTVFENGGPGVPIEVVIGENCIETINDFTTLKEGPDGGKLKEERKDPILKKNYQAVGHFTDLFDYFMCYAFAQSYSDFQRAGSISIPTSGKNKSGHGY